MTNDRFATATVGEIVAADFRHAAVFERFGIDFCCNGRRSLADACQAAAADRASVVQALEQVPAGSAGKDAAVLPLPLLIDHIVAVHHAYVRGAAPIIGEHLARVEKAHGRRHPELREVAAAFGELCAGLEQHMMKEEVILFPYVRDLADRVEVCGFAPSPFGTVENPIRMMEREHEEAGGLLAAIRGLTGGYATPEDGCATWRVAMAELLAFERDLHRHVHLENNVLFPAAVRLEERRA